MSPQFNLAKLYLVIFVQREPWRCIDIATYFDVALACAHRHMVIHPRLATVSPECFRLFVPSPRFFLRLKNRFVFTFVRRFT